MAEEKKEKRPLTPKQIEALEKRKADAAAKKAAAQSGETHTAPVTSSPETIEEKEEEVLEDGKFKVVRHFHDGKEYKIGTGLESAKEIWLKLGLVEKV